MVVVDFGTHVDNSAIFREKQAPLAHYFKKKHVDKWWITMWITFLKCG